MEGDPETASTLSTWRQLVSWICNGPVVDDNGNFRKKLLCVALSSSTLLHLCCTPGEGGEDSLCSLHGDYFDYVEEIV